MTTTKKHPGKPKKGTMLWKLGLWATVWWAVFCLYILLFVWQGIEYSKNQDTLGETLSWFTGGKLNFGYEIAGFNSIFLLGIFVLLGWVILGYLWVRTLKQERISIKSGLKDLFCTIRK